MKRQLLACLLCLVAVFVAAPIHASTFDPNLILTDVEMRDADAMDIADIAVFLAGKGGLGRYYDADPTDGLLKGAAQLIADASRRYSINPRYLLALIQKESSAVEAAAPTREQLDWATGYALCDGCTKTSATKYRGLGKQIDAGAAWMNWYLKSGQAPAGQRQVGTPYSISHITVTPANLTTAALYGYTPHLHGNRLLWSIWQNWFGGAPPDYPDGTVIRNEKNGAVGVIQNGRLRAMASASVLQTRFHGVPIVDVNEFDFRALENERPGRPLRLPDQAVVRTETGDLFLLVGNSKRRFVSAEAFGRLGFNPEELEDVVTADIADYADGDALGDDNDTGASKLLQDKATGGVYLVRGEEKQPLLDRAILDQFPALITKPVAATELMRYQTAEPVKLADGRLVKTAGVPAVYLISGGERRVIKTEAAFASLGYQWNQVVTVSRRLLELHPLGKPIGD
ncbi:MAG: hypothetical protein PHT12_01045 [Patescibacteria group bacterium]|nr:hypothetical protein [Patescibacteria group bacterium]